MVLFFLSVYSFCFFFFFSSRRRHTRFDCDWSSDVCSSDLWPDPEGNPLIGTILLRQSVFLDRKLPQLARSRTPRPKSLNSFLARAMAWEIGRASCRERV